MALTLSGAAAPLAERCAALDAQLWRVNSRIAAGDSLHAIAVGLLDEARRSGEPAALLPALHATSRILDARRADRGRDSAVAAGLALARTRGDSLWAARFLVRAGLDVLRARRPAPIDSIARLVSAAAEAAGDRGLLAESMRMHAEAAIGQARWARSESLFMAALPGLRASGRSAAEVRVHTSLGQVLAMLARPQRAAAHLDTAAALATALDESDLLLAALGNQVTLLFFRSRFEEGLAVTRRMQPLAAASPDPAARFTVLDRQISFAFELGRPQEGARYADTMAVLARALAAPKWELRARLMLAFGAMREGRFEEAATSYRRLLASGDSLDAFNRGAAVRHLGRALADMDSLGAACALVRSHLDGPLYAAPLDRLLALGEMAGWQRRMGDARAARRSAEAALALARQVDDRGNVLTMHTQLALVHESASRPDLAWASFDSARALWESYRTSSRTGEWRDVASALGRDVAWAGLRLTARFPEHVRAQGSMGRAAQQFDLVESLRGRALLERIRPVESGAASAVAPTTVTALRTRLLRPGELLLSAFVCPDTAVVFALDRDSLSVHAIPLARREVIARVQALHRLLATPPSERHAAATAAMDSGLAWASRELVTPLAPRLERASSVVVAPDGVLGLLPIGTMLQSASPRGDQLEVSQIPSASVLVAIREREVHAGSLSDSLLAMSGPDPQRPSGDLPGSAREVAWLMRRFHRVVRAEAGQTQGAAWSRFGLLHLAVHSQADDEAPWRSAMRVGREPESGWQGMVEASDLSALSLRARLAVLSGCQTAQSRHLSGEGLIGLSTAFIVAGVPSVLATQWRVDDRVAEQFVRRFYEHLSAGRSAAAALSAARRELAARAETADPFHWASFVLVGEPGTRVALSQRGVFDRAAQPVPLAIVALVLVSAAAWWWRRRAASG